MDDLLYPEISPSGWKIFNYTLIYILIFTSFAVHIKIIDKGYQMKEVTISETVTIGKRTKFTFNNLTLSPDHPNVVYLPISGNRRDSSTEETIGDFYEYFTRYHGKYEILLIPVVGDF